MELFEAVQNLNYVDKKEGSKREPLLESDVNSPYFKAYITNLGKYNEGELIGQWVEFPIDEDEFNDVLEEIGIGTVDNFGAPYEEWFVTDYECNLDGFDWQQLGEYPSYEKLQEFGELIDGIEDVDAVNAAYEATGDLKRAIEGIDKGNIRYYSNVGSEEDLAYAVIEELGGLEELGKDDIERYFDYEQLGRDLRIEYYNPDNEDETAAQYYCGDSDATDEEIGQAYVDDIGFANVSNPDNYFDYKKYGHDLVMGDFSIVGNGAVEIMD